MGIITNYKIRSLIKIYCNRCLIISIALFSLIPVQDHSQIILQFPNGPGDGTLISGTAGAVGAIYQWLNVGTDGAITIKAKVEIISIIGGATLTTIDGSSTAVDWEPQVAGPTKTAGNSWGIKFQVRFYNAANNAPYILSSLKAQGIDIDGGGAGSALREFNVFDSPGSYTLETPTDLTATAVAGGIKFQSGQNAFSGISINQTQLIASCNYANINTISITCGVVAVGGTVPAGNRLHSFNFRNVVVFNDPINLPVEFVDFKASKESYVDIKWITASEFNNDYFTLERYDELIFTPISIINGAGNSTIVNEYHYEDKEAPQAILYYRLKQTDFDGKVSFSEIISFDNRVYKKEIDTITNLLGIEVNEFYKGIVIVLYKDGSTSKVIQ